MDHAQVVAIRAWLARQLPGWPIVEVDKDQVRHSMKSLQRLVGPEDRIILHSGGNLGDRGAVVGERAPGHDRGLSGPPHLEPAADHPLLRHRTGAGRASPKRRDPWSAPEARRHRPGSSERRARGRAVSGSGQLRLPRLRALTPPPGFDTTFDHRIEVEARPAELDAILARFAAADAVVTDRYHGLIFSVLSRRPTVVLPTVDHELSSAAHWFRHVEHVRLADEPEEVPGLLSAVLTAQDFTTPDWNRLYFDDLLARVETEGTARWGSAAGSKASLRRTREPGR